MVPLAGSVDSTETDGATEAPPAVRGPFSPPLPAGLLSFWSCGTFLASCRMSCLRQNAGFNAADLNPLSHLLPPWCDFLDPLRRAVQLGPRLLCLSPVLLVFLERHLLTNVPVTVEPRSSGFCWIYLSVCSQNNNRQQIDLDQI